LTFKLKIITGGYSLTSGNHAVSAADVAAVLHNNINEDNFFGHNFSASTKMTKQTLQ